MSDLVERLRNASSNVAYARQEGTTGFLAGWEHLVMRQSADRIAELETRVAYLEGFLRESDRQYERAALNPSARSE